MDIGAVITAAVAISGLALSIRHEVQQQRDRHPRVQTTLMLGTMKVVSESPQRAMLLDDRTGNPTPSDLILAAGNTGERLVTLSGLGVLLPNGVLFPLVPDSSSGELPCRLTPDEVFRAWWPASDVARRLEAAGFTGTVQLVGYYADQRGRLYRSKRFTFDLDTWSTLCR